MAWCRRKSTHCLSVAALSSSPGACSSPPRVDASERLWFRDCSPEFYVVNDRPVAAFDLADEGPQLAEYLPNITTIADISDTRGQMALFDRLIAEKDTPVVIDVSYRAFKDFFTVVQQIHFFQEARHRFIEPLILFIIDPDPKSAKAYTTLRHQLSEAPLIPVRNQTEAGAILCGDAGKGEHGSCFA
jgi:hypothetical protein